MGFDGRARNNSCEDHQSLHQLLLTDDQDP
jgi:hypothetical protein